jgi:hypothetical protein
MLDKNMRIRARPETKVVNLKQLVALLRSKDRNQWAEAKWVFDPNHFRFLDGEFNPSNKIAFASFPRSGNTFLRKYIELLTGIQTGADNTLHVNVSLQMMGMKGEDIVDDTVWVRKTHSPWCMPYAPLFHCNKMVIVVRNPLDVIVSWLNLVAQGCHNSKSEYTVEKDYPNWWHKWAIDTAKYIRDWFAVYLKDAALRKLPIVWFRFEDMIMNPEPHLYDMMRVFTSQSDLAGTNAELRV